MSTATDDFIRSSGNLAYVNTWLKLISVVLLLLCLILGAALVVKIIDGRSEHCAHRNQPGYRRCNYCRLPGSRAASEERSPVRSPEVLRGFLNRILHITVIR